MGREIGGTSRDRTNDLIGANDEALQHKHRQFVIIHSPWSITYPIDSGAAARQASSLSSAFLESMFNERYGDSS